MAQEIINSVSENWKNLTCNNLNSSTIILNNTNLNTTISDLQSDVTILENQSNTNNNDIISLQNDKVNKSGDTMSGQINMNSNPITNISYANFNGSYAGNLQKTISLRYGSTDTMIDNFLGNGIGNNDFILNCVDGFSKFVFLRANSSTVNSESARISDAGIQSTRGNFTATVGGLITQRMRFDSSTTNNQITSITGGISIIPLAGQNTNITTSGAGTITLASANPVLISTGLNMQNGNITNTTLIDGGSSAIQVGSFQPCVIPSKDYSLLSITSASIFLVTAGVWRLLNNAANSIQNSTGFTNNAPTFSAQYTGTRNNRLMKVFASVSGIIAAGNSNITIMISKNGNLIPLSTNNRAQMNFTNSQTQVTVEDFVTMSNTDTIQIALLSSATTTLTTSFCSILISSELN